MLPPPTPESSLLWPVLALAHGAALGAAAGGAGVLVLTARRLRIDPGFLFYDLVRGRGAPRPLPIMPPRPHPIVRTWRRAYELGALRGVRMSWASAPFGAPLKESLLCRFRGGRMLIRINLSTDPEGSTAIVAMLHEQVHRDCAGHGPNYYRALQLRLQAAGLLDDVVAYRDSLSLRLMEGAARINLAYCDQHVRRRPTRPTFRRKARAVLKVPDSHSRGTP